MSHGGDFSLIDLFQEEVRAHSAVLNQGLVELESDASNPRHIEPLMRAAHSIKGAARIVGIDRAVELAHVMEDVFVAAQEGRIAINAATIDRLLRGTDLLSELSTVTEQSASAWENKYAQEIAALHTILSAIAAGRTVAEPAAPSTSVPVAVERGPQPSAGTSDSASSLAAIAGIAIASEPLPASDELTMLDVFREEVRSQTLALQQGLIELAAVPQEVSRYEALAEAANAIRGAASIVDLPIVVRLSQKLKELFLRQRSLGAPLAAADWQGLVVSLAWFAEIPSLAPQDVPGWCHEQMSQIAELIERWNTASTPAAQAVAPPAAAPLQAVATPAAAATAATTEAGKGPAVDVPTAPGPVAPKNVPAEATEAVVRVSAHSLNRLMGLAGESLVQARWLQPFSTALLKLKKQQDQIASALDNLSHALPAENASDHLVGLVEEARRSTITCRQVLADRLLEFDNHAAQAEDLNTRLYHEVIVSRMRPFGDGAAGFPRLVRDMARQLDKQVRLEIDGLETEVDRDVLEKLEAPLTHLLRNAVDHGIESPEARAAAGKPASGTIKLEVRHRAGMLAITITDDGGGIDVERVRRKIVERGLTTAELTQAMTPAEIFEFLFLPGFSTTSQVTEYSGRGVGLDVVQQSVRRAGGVVRVHSQVGQGTTFHLQLPITLSVLRAVLVEIDGEPYAFPHNRIDRLLKVSVDEIQSLEGRQFVVVDGQNVGLLSAAQVLGLPVRSGIAKAADLLVILLSDSVGQYGLVVDRFRGEQDLVVRPLDARLGKVPNLSAAAILEDGSPVLIVDVEDLIRSLDRYLQNSVLRRHARAAATAGSKKRVLVVDDSITVREVERQILRGQGYEVSVAVDGQEGWNMVRAEKFDLLISDVDMPRMNGLELVALVRGEAALRDLPVIIVSYKERPEDRLKGLDVGANYYLTKSSFHDDTFLQAVRDCIGEAQ